MSLTFNFKSWKRIAFSFVALLLCFILILAPFRVSAVAGVDDALFWILVAILGASGISFVSLSDAHTQCDSFYNSLSDSIKDTLIEKANLIAGSSAIVSGVKVGMQFYAEQWQQLTNAIISKFGNKGTYAVNGYVEGRKLNINDINDSFLAYNYYYVGQITTSQVGNLSITSFTGSDFNNVIKYLSQEELSNLNISDSRVYRNYSLANGLFTTYDTMATATNKNITSKSYFAWSKDNGYIRDVSYASVPYLGSYCKYYLGDKVHYTDKVTNSIHYITIYTDNLSNIVDLTTSTLVGTSISVPTSVVSREGVWTGEEWGQFLNDLIFGNDISGLINCDPSAYPNIDTWHDGIGEDVATVDNPVGSIGISVPTSNDDVIDLSPSTARDYDGTTIKDKDITTTSNPDDTGNGNDDNTNTNPKKDTPSKILPGLSLPEILFKHKFPFCLPYDIYAMCLGLRSDNAEPPVFSIPYKNDTLNIDLEYEIDFEDFDEVISILRFFVGATFTVGLIFATRKLIWK